MRQAVCGVAEGQGLTGKCLPLRGLPGPGGLTIS